MTKNPIRRIVHLLIFTLSACTHTKAQNADLLLLKACNAGYHPTWDKVNEGISFSVYPVMPLSVAGVWYVGFRKKDSLMKRNAWRSLATICAANGTSIILKSLIKRERPYVTYPNEITQRVLTGPLSFPSGHTTAAFATATSLSLSFKKWEVAVPAFFYAGMVGYSRLRLGVHYPSDVAAGALIGIGSGFLVWKLDELLFAKQKKKGIP